LTSCIIFNLLKLFERSLVAPPLDDDFEDSNDSGGDFGGVSLSKQWCEGAYAAVANNGDSMLQLWNESFPQEAFATKRQFLTATRAVGFRFRRTLAESLALVRTIDKQASAFATAGAETYRDAIAGA